MKIASAPRARSDMRILVVDAKRGAMGATSAAEISTLFRPGDLVVVNDAATLPASLSARDPAGNALEIRLAGAESSWSHGRASALSFPAVLFGAGDHRLPTEERPPPPRVRVGGELDVGKTLVARIRSVSDLSPRLVEIELARKRSSNVRTVRWERESESDCDDARLRADAWAALYAEANVIQYSYVPRPLALWDVQNAWAARPWAVEMPSAGRALATETLAALAARGVEVARITHAAGLSSTGDPKLDAALPLAERFEVGERAVSAVRRTKLAGGRVVAIGTSVVRALETAARSSAPGEIIAPASGLTTLRMSAEEPWHLVDGVLTGVHEPGTSHHALIGAFLPPRAIAEALAESERLGLYGHELGDGWLVWADFPAQRATSRAAARAAIEAQGTSGVGVESTPPRPTWERGGTGGP